MTIIELSPQEVQEQLAAGKILLIDVREPAEFQDERIAGARSMPLSSFDPHRLPAPGEQAVVFHCGIGKRSAMAIDRCAAAGVGHVTHLRGGLQAWRVAGLPTIAG
jgi:rhodanese-related sulfurtransferase